MNEDHVDHVLEQWKKEKPEIDPSSMAVVGRLLRVKNFLSLNLQTAYKEYSLNIGEFDLLATILRSGKPYALTPNQLLSSLMLSSGAMTNRIDKLESRKLVHRRSNPLDRRGTLVQLTPKGRKLISEVINTHIESCDKFLQGINKSEQEVLATLLKKILIRCELP